MLSPTLLNNSVTLQWDANTDFIIGYRLYWGFLSRVYIFSVDVGNVTEFEIENLEIGKYYFAVTAYNGFTESNFSNEVSCEIELFSFQVSTLHLSSDR